jgi:hypothetical protein
MARCTEDIRIIPVTPRMKDITGQTINNLKVLGYVGKNEKGTHTLWLCKCKCGNETIVEGGNLRGGHTKSCGCLAIQRIVDHNRKHGMRGSRIYDCWRSMKSRCSNPKDEGYFRYGGRGISYDPKWETFEGFYEDMKDGYNDELTLDRIEVNEGYSKSNCKWSTPTEQAHNRRNNKKVIYKGKEHKLVDLYKELECDIPYGTVLDRLQSGWSAERALTEPKGGYKG